MDTAKAFDVVNHHVMLDTLYKQGVQGPLWKMYYSMYSGIQSSVKWNGNLSTPFPELQGIRQGGPSSADIYIRLARIPCCDNSLHSQTTKLVILMSVL